MENFTTLHSSTNRTLFPFWQTGIVEICMLSYSFMSGISIYSYVMWLLVTRTGSGALSDFFNFNLSLCGIFFSVNSLLILVSKWFPYPGLIALTQFLVGPGITGRPLFQCLICVERYLAVVHPVTFLKYKPLRYRVICVAVAWIITLVSCVSCIFVFFTCPYYIFAWYFSTQFLLFLSFQLFCLVAVLRALNQPGPIQQKREKGKETLMKRRAFHLILVTSISLVITYIPFMISAVISILTNKSFPIIWSISYICFVLADLLHPVHYLHRAGKLKALSGSAKLFFHRCR